MGLPEERFWKLTPRMFWALVDRMIQQQKLENARHGIVEKPKMSAEQMRTMAYAMAGVPLPGKPEA